MHWEEQFREHAARNEGLVAKFHVAILGCTPDHWWRAERSGRWELLSGRVLRLRGTPETDTQRALAATLDASPGAMLHGASALAWFALRGCDLGTLHVARPRGLSGLKPRLAHVHRLRDIRAHDVMVARGVATETPLRAIWAEADRYSSQRLFEVGLAKIGRLLDTAHVQGLVTWAALHEAVTDIGERGRGGTRLMRSLAEERSPGTSPTESRNEGRLEELLASAGAPPLRRQVVVGGYEPIGRADFRDATLPLVVEVNSLAFHSAPTDRAADETRYGRLNDSGFVVAVIWELDLWSRTHAALETVAQARRLAATGCRAVLHSPSCPWPDPSRLPGTRICA